MLQWIKDKTEAIANHDATKKVVFVVGAIACIVATVAITKAVCDSNNGFADSLSSTGRIDFSSGDWFVADLIDRDDITMDVMDRIIAIMDESGEAVAYGVLDSFS